MVVEMRTAQKNQINLGLENLILLQGMLSCLPFLLFPGLFEIIAQSAHRSAISFFECKWEKLSCTEKGTKSAYQPDFAALGLSSACLKLKYVNLLVQKLIFEVWSVNSSLTNYTYM